MRAPHTWFSTEFNSGKGFLKLRLRSLLSGPKRRGVLPILLTLLCVATFGTMVACDQAAAPEAPAATARSSPPPSPTTPRTWPERRACANSSPPPDPMTMF